MQPVKEVYARTQSSERGLSSAEAARRLGERGRNVLKEGKKRSKIGLFFSQFKDVMTLILTAAAFLSGVLAFVTGDKSELADAGILLFVILLNAIVGFIQQYRADAAIEKLKDLSRATAKAVRDGAVKTVDAEELVVGDVVEIAEGDRIPADCRVLSAEDCRVDESALTGESRPAAKRAGTVSKRALAERSNTVHLATFCVKGNARCLVVATGMDTETGKIARLLSETAPPPSSLDRLVKKLGKIVTAAVFCVAALLFVFGLLARRVSFLDDLMTAVAVAVAAIPEGMGAVVTVILAMGVRRMAKRRAIVRKLAAVQTLGGCTCICSDKTGTLTKNRMTVEEIATDFSRPAELLSRTPAQEELLRCIRACHSVKGEAGSYLGDPTEIALLEYADRAGFSYSPRIVGGTPFSSERKRMSVLAEENGRLYVKGAPDVLLKLCTRMWKKGRMTAEDRAAIEERVSRFSSRAMRVLAFAEGEGEREEDLCFLGLAALFDPPKEGAKKAVEACKRAGVRTVMITGDGAETAFAVASRLGIAKSRAEVVTGEEMEALGEEYARRAGEFSVYARVSPKHKSAIVKALKACGEVVAMTGDGVNDAPSIREADVGIAMGSGTDVTKSAADVVIADDDFSTVVKAVEEGRNVFCNVQKTISFFLSTNLAEVLAVLLVTLFFRGLFFLNSTQLLWINLVTDSLPVLALGVERTEGAMLLPPVSERDIFSRRSVLHMLFFGLLQTALVVGIFAFGARAWGNGPAATAAFLVLSFAELLHVFNVRAGYGKAKPFSNRVLLATVAVGILLNVLVVAVPPFASAFGLSPLGFAQWTAVALCSLAPLPVGALYHAIARLAARKKGRRGASRRWRKEVRTA